MTARAAVKKRERRASRSSVQSAVIYEVIRAIAFESPRCLRRLAWALYTLPSAAQTFERGVGRITRDGREAALSVEIARSAHAGTHGQGGTG